MSRPSSRRISLAKTAPPDRKSRCDERLAGCDVGSSPRLMGEKSQRLEQFDPLGPFADTILPPNGIPSNILAPRSEKV